MQSVGIGLVRRWIDRLGVVDDGVLDEDRRASAKREGNRVARARIDLYLPAILAKHDAGIEDIVRKFGDRDPLYPVSIAFELHRAIPRSYLWVVPNGGHGPIFGDAASHFATTALAFLRGEWR